MKQHGDARWSGHREISYAAADRLFDELAGADGLIRGISRSEYAEALDKAQAHQDRPLGAGLIKNFANSGLSFPYVGPGPTMHSAYANPEVQRQHFMADPYRRGGDNLRTNVDYIHAEVVAAQVASGDDRFAHLGAAAHALQDSYSGAHAWREDSVYDGDPGARVQSLHVFTPAHAVGIDDGRNTHSDAFDEPPVQSGSTRAAVEATYRLLSAFERGLDRPDQAEQLMHATLDPMLQPAPTGVTVNVTPGPEWAAERDRRLGLEHGTAAPTIPGDELSRLKAVLADHGPVGRPADGAGLSGALESAARADSAVRRGQAPGGRDSTAERA
ncbi:hypothetical protein [Kribbella monticola]|uniref:hypothetical protein n=1 Tax=Kribbella monticola TaxID=2185285 RepID=UPI000DD43409|nr:hypothetical protein [Kribbella monticola]